MRHVVRSHLRSPIALLWWNVGIKPKNEVVGVLLGHRFYARPVPSSMPIGRYIDSLVVRGRVRPNPDGGCDVEIHAAPSRATRVVIPGVMVAIAAVLALLAIVSGQAGLLIGVGLVIAGLLFNALVLRVHRSSEASEVKLLREWVNTLARDIEATSVVGGAA